MLGRLPHLIQNDTEIHSISHRIDHFQQYQRLFTQLDILFHDLFNLRALDLNNHFSAIHQHRIVHLSDRC